MEIEGCALEIAFDSDSTLYRRDCNNKLQKYEQQNWVNLSDMQGQSIAAGEGGLWISDYDSDKVHKWDPKTNSFLVQGMLRGSAKAVGISVICADYQDNLSLKKWNGESWSDYDDAEISSLAIDSEGVVYVVNNKSIYKQDCPELKTVGVNTSL